MKINLQFTLTIFLSLSLLTARARDRYPKTDKDSIIVTFGDKTRLIIYGENKKELDKILKYDLNALLRDLKMKLDSTKTDTTILREEVNGKDYLRDREGTDKEYVRIGLKGIHVKDGETEVRVDAHGVEVKEDGAEVTTNSNYKRIGKHIGRGSWGSSPRKGFNMALGLNTYGSNKATAGFNKADYDLKPFGSRFVSLGYVATTPIARGKTTRLHLDFGGDFSWYNLMYEGNNTVVKNASAVTFQTVKDSDGNELNLKKTKLVAPYLNLSLMPTLSFSRSFISYLSAGVYGGYRLGGYTKVKQEGSKDVEKDHKDFYMNDFRYGLAAEIGIRHFPDLFINYDSNELFRDNKGPSVRMLSFGIRLF
ncbi:hypothetical protein DYBT9275_04313 [Dyadobacter sp. CECT 9275]|uniref:Outer membrane protein beta-barrel domain-containing protein n=1 Tax=Dyadobacter helix TaxID=2822344 RepID=A0A916JGG4_9BACT|nr:outer membrane beta-barrel protein [Dyadobacter sp. CECT 9275]CAG5008590.1 hypothetical protein DYBT9275_04313 [Dyadobacter sp. CECT 9275]